MSWYLDEFGRRIDLDVRPVPCTRGLVRMRRCGEVHGNRHCELCALMYKADIRHAGTPARRRMEERVKAAREARRATR